jgi:DNA-binding winged helix-turn-helix (wHTH) protein
MVRFGAFEFDAESRRLRRDGADIHLSPKAFYLLSLLLEAAPRVIGKRELHEKLWPGGAVADATLVALIKQLRGALVCGRCGVISATLWGPTTSSAADGARAV